MSTDELLAIFRDLYQQWKTADEQRKKKIDKAWEKVYGPYLSDK
ncbi:MAG: hypothetical protein ACJ8R9_10800 [Steroidobacteraceae bacterium]